MPWMKVTENMKIWVPTSKDDKPIPLYNGVKWSSLDHSGGELTLNGKQFLKLVKLFTENGEDDDE